MSEARDLAGRSQRRTVNQDEATACFYARKVVELKSFVRTTKRGGTCY
ncbi:hypothetical protein [Paenibacillus peoriae]|nr:hypothetical protein [Paenibacillus peoriae]